MNDEENLDIDSPLDIMLYVNFYFYIKPGKGIKVLKLHKYFYLKYCFHSKRK